MAIDTGSKNDQQELSLDDIEVVVLIIAKNPKSLTSASTFLSRRGWPTTVLSNLSQAIEFASDKKPDFVLISANHPNPGLNKFVDLITNSFGLTCVAFAEGNDTTSSSKLSKSKIALKISGQASGPNLHRSLRKILAERLNINVDEKSSERSTANNDDRSMTIKNDGASGSRGPTFIKGEEAAEEHEATMGEDEVSNGKYTMAKKRRSLKELTQQTNDRMGKANSAEMAKAMSEAHAATQEGSESKQGAGILASQAEPAPASATSATNSPASSSSQAKPASTSPKAAKASTGNSMVQEPKKAAPRSLADMAAQVGNSLAVEEPRPNKPKLADIRPVGLIKTEPAPPPRLDAVGPHSLVQTAVQTALDKICRPATDKLSPIDLIEEVGVFPVDSPTLPGYLVLAWPNSETRAKEAFFKQAQQILHSVFVEMGVQARLEPGFFVTIPQVRFPTWSEEAATFSFTTTHGDQEIGIAFFKTNKPIPKPQKVADNTMYAIGVEDISTVQPVNFKVYLHMKKNKKYFLYLRNGRQLQPEQKERLQGHKVKDFYMKTIDAENLRMFLASCYLREKIKKVA